MQVKHKGDHVQVVLTKPEELLLLKASDVLEMVSRLPCEQSNHAADAYELVSALAVELAKPERKQEEETE